MASKKEAALPTYEPPEGTLDRDTLDHCFYFEIIKDKQSIGKQAISKKGALVFGRAEQADVQVAHPSLSRQHAVVLHVMVGKEGEEKKPGVAVMDLGSAQGTLINGKKIKPKMQFPMKPDYWFSLGKSTRRYYLRHDPSLKRPVFKAASEQKENESERQQGVKRKADEPVPAGPKVAVRKLSEAEIKKLKAKKKGEASQSVGARKLVSSQFKNMVAMPIVATVPGTATLESMAAGDQEEEEPEEEPKPEEAEEKAPEGDEPGAEADDGPAGSWLFKPDSAVQRRDEDSD